MQTEQKITNFPIPTKTLVKILRTHQKIKALRSLNKIDRAKTNLTKKQVCNKLAQMGYTLNYKKCSFTFENGMGCLRKANGCGIIGATISDFIQEVKVSYGITLRIAE